MKSAYADVRGFTIVELLIVVVVIGILATISVVAYNTVRDKAEFASVQSDTTNIAKQLELFKTTNDAYPTAIDDCPTPGVTTLCLSSGSNTIKYKKLDGITQGGRAIGPAYELTVLGDKSFLYSSSAEIAGTTEFVGYTDLAPIFDQYGLVNYKLSFDIKSANVDSQNTITVYLHNGSDIRHYFAKSIPISTSYAHHELIVKPSLSDASVAASWLRFYGVWSSGNIPTIKNLRLELAK
ncbi:prepilin-type N-terminal cleavage/methylation domain-containing protein [Candidatus Saccharibacteria bacterium]|nr:prepilin-type N-terminal cleavage/methylation domain-containing protein [Candidatus Saccharibacteria bacterium]